MVPWLAALRTTDAFHYSAFSSGRSQLEQLDCIFLPWDKVELVLQQLWFDLLYLAFVAVQPFRHTAFNPVRGTVDPYQRATAPNCALVPPLFGP